MKQIVLISCVSKKLQVPAKAKDLYTSPLFKKNMLYAQKLEPDEVYILSAKYGLLSLNQETEPYDQTLNNMTTLEIKEWAKNVLIQLKEVTSLENTEFIFLAGDRYRKYILPHMKHYKIPLKGLSIGKQLRSIKRACIMSRECDSLTKIESPPYCESPPVY
jgi:hypothetical protein